MAERRPSNAERTVACRLSKPDAHSLDKKADVRVAELAGGCWGVLSIDELRECGLSTQAVSVRARNGRLHRMHQSVYAVGHPNPPLEGRFLAATKACRPGAVLSHFSAAAYFGFLGWEGRYPEVTVLGTSTRVLPGLRVHRTSALPPVDVVTHRGIQCTSPARTLLDLAAALGYKALRRAVRQAISLRLVHLGQLADVLTRFGRRHGSQKLARIVAAGTTHTRSELEDVVLDLIAAGDLRRPEVNSPLTIDGRRIIPDFRWPGQRLIVEADGAAWHNDKLAREDDAERQAILEASGEQVLRVTWSQAVSEPSRTLARFRAAGAPQS